MEFLKLETVTKLLGSWSLLFALMFVSTTLLILPNEWLIEPAVSKVRAQHLGVIGLTAITSWLFIIAKTIISISTKIPALIEKFKANKERKKNIEKHKKKTIKQLQCLDPSLKNFLLNKKENSEQKFKLDASEGTMKPLHDARILHLYEHFGNIWEVEILDWVWNKLSHEFLFPINDTPDEKST